MNTKNDLKKRLLNLYPVKLVKEFFNIEETLVKSDLIAEVLKRYNDNAIVEFAMKNIMQTKQHIYIFELDPEFKRKNFIDNDFPLKILSQSNDGTSHYFFMTPIVTFKSVLNDPFETVDINFLQPIAMCLRKGYLIVHATMLEKNIGSYVHGGRKVLDVERSNNNDFIDLIVSHFAASHTVTICDLHKGVKFLWEDDTIDSKSVKFKKEKSVATEVMDQDFTVKEQYPDVYAKLMKGPLNKTHFKYLKDDDSLCSNFTTDPSTGQLSVTLYPSNPTQITNVVDKILSNN